MSLLEAALLDILLDIHLKHDDVIKWKHFPRYWPFVRGITRSPMKSPHKGQGREALMLSLICAQINGWVNNREVGDLRRHRTNYDVTVMSLNISSSHNVVLYCLVFFFKFCRRRVGIWAKFLNGWAIEINAIHKWNSAGFEMCLLEYHIAMGW